MNVTVIRGKYDEISMKKLSDRVVVRVPCHTSIEIIRKHLLANKHLLLYSDLVSHNTVLQSAIANFGDNIVARQLLEAYKIMVDGKLFSIVLGKHNSIESEMIVGMDNLIMSDINSRRKCIKSFVANHAKRKLRSRVSDIGNQLHLCISNVKLEYIKGNNWIKHSSNDREIILDYRLVQLPIEVQRFAITVAFELAYDSVNCKSIYGHNFDRFIEQCNRYLFIKYLQ